MQIESQSLDAGTRWIKLTGRMDIRGAREIGTKLADLTTHQRDVIVDMSAVNFLDSSGIRALLLSAKQVSARNGKMILQNPAPHITKVLETAGIDSLIPICHSLDEARSTVAH